MTTPTLTATSTLNEQIDVITDTSEVLPAFCESLEEILRQGLKRGLGALGLADRDYWNCIEGLTKSSKVTHRVPPSASHVIHVVHECRKVQTSLSRGRLFLRIALTKGILVQALQALLENQEYVRYWYKETSLLVNYQQKGVVLEILKALKKKKYNLDVNNCSFLDESWLMPCMQCFEFVPTANLGVTLFTVDGKCMVINVKEGSAADEIAPFARLFYCVSRKLCHSTVAQRVLSETVYVKVQGHIVAGDCIVELFGVLIDERMSLRINDLKRKNKGKPITCTFVKGRFPDGRWYSPLYSRYRTLVAAGKCNPEIPKEYSENKPPNDQDEVTARHTFFVDYLGCTDVGKKSIDWFLGVAFHRKWVLSKDVNVKIQHGGCTFVQDGIQKLNPKDYKKVKLKLQLMERDIILTDIEKNEVFMKYSYTETSSCALYDNDRRLFGFMTGNTTCSFADHFVCHIFAAESTIMAKQIIEGIGKGFDRTVYCV